LQVHIEAQGKGGKIGNTTTSEGDKTPTNQEDVGHHNTFSQRGKAQDFAIQQDPVEQDRTDSLGNSLGDRKRKFEQTPNDTKNRAKRQHVLTSVDASTFRTKEAKDRQALSEIAANAFRRPETPEKVSSSSDLSKPVKASTPEDFYASLMKGKIPPPDRSREVEVYSMQAAEGEHYLEDNSYQASRQQYDDDARAFHRDLHDAITTLETILYNSRDRRGWRRRNIAHETADVISPLDPRNGVPLNESFRYVGDLLRHIGDHVEDMVQLRIRRQNIRQDLSLDRREGAAQVAAIDEERRTNRSIIESKFALMMQYAQKYISGDVSSNNWVNNDYQQIRRFCNQAQMGDWFTFERAYSHHSHLPGEPIGTRDLLDHARTLEGDLSSDDEQQSSSQQSSSYERANSPDEQYYQDGSDTE